jgi:dolichyl-phosphate-mannose-protein mannosyltransferase
MSTTGFPHRTFGVPTGGVKRDSLRDRLTPPMPADIRWGWAGPLIVALFGGYLRFHRLDQPWKFGFDETYYAKEAFSLITYGVERNFIADADSLLLAGFTDVYQKCQVVAQCAARVVHPPLGKWMIGFGELLFGVNPYGWRFMAALCGTLSILVLARVARRMARSTLLGCLAGLVLALDGLHFVLSRSAMLDIFLMFWLVAGFACLVVDRDRMRERLADWYESAERDMTRPRLGARRWRLAAGLCLGAALATKWSAVFFIAAFAIMSLLWDAGARRAVGRPAPYAETARRDLPLATVWLGAVSAVVYLASWIGWLASDKGYSRNWAEATSGGRVHFVVDSLRSLVGYHISSLEFHTDLHATHSAASYPWTWPLLVNPVAFVRQTGPCGAGRCVTAVNATGTPVIWFVALIALAALIAWYVADRDWRAGAVLAGYASGWLPWFYYAIADHRTMFLTYAVVMVPFMALAIALASGLLIGPADATSRRRLVGAALVGAFAMLALINFTWLYPFIAADPVSVEEYARRLLYPSWS